MFELKIASANNSMDWLEWSASIVGSIAWPVAAITIAFLFRSQIASLLNKIRRLTWGDKAIDFADKLDEIEKASQTALVELDAESAAPMPDERFQQLLLISPSAAVIDSWKPVESRLRELAAQLPNENQWRKTFTSRQAIEALHRAGRIPSTTHEILRDLQALRNLAAHQQEVTPTDAIRFNSFSAKVLRQLENF